MRRHAKRDNLVVLAELFELSRGMALMAVKYKEAIGSNCAALRMLIEMLKPGKPKLICCPAVLADSNYPIAWEVIIFILSREVILA
jgi:hypothetical protein